MVSQQEINKMVVRRFNREVIGEGNIVVFRELMDDTFINHTVASGSDKGPEGMINTFNKILRPAMPDLTVIIHEQIAEGDLVTTRKTIQGTHLGPFLGISATGRQIRIDVIDIIRIRAGKYLEHWGINTLPLVLSHLKEMNL